MRAILEFISNPKEYYTKQSQLKKGLKPFFLTLLSSILLLYITSIIFNVIGIEAYNTQLEQGRMSKLAILVTLILAPLHEELLFRLPLILNVKNITIGISLLIGTVISLILTQYLGSYSYQGIPLFQILSLSTAILIFLALKKLITKKEQPILLFLNKRYNLFFFFLLFLFTSSHYLNYRYQTLDTTYIIYLFVIYLIYTYSLSFIRITLGIKYSIALHFIYLTPAIISTLL